MGFNSQDFINFPGTFFLPDNSEGGGEPLPAISVVVNGSNSPWQSEVDKPVEWTGHSPGYHHGPIRIPDFIGIAVSGVGYNLGDIVTLDVGTGSPETQLQIIAIIAGSVPQAVGIISNGHYPDVAFPDPIPTTGGHGTGLTVHVAGYVTVNLDADDLDVAGCHAANVGNFPISLLKASPTVNAGINGNYLSDLDPTSIRSMPGAKLEKPLYYILLANDSMGNGVSISGRPTIARSATVPKDSNFFFNFDSPDGPFIAGEHCHPLYFFLIYFLQFTYIIDYPHILAVQGGQLVSFIDDLTFNNCNTGFAALDYLPIIVEPAMSGFQPVPALGQKNQILRLCLFWAKIKDTTAG